MQTLTQTTAWILLAAAGTLIAADARQNPKTVDNDFALIRARMRHLAMGCAPGDARVAPPDADRLAQAKRWSAAQTPDGGWNDIDYASRRRSGWPSRTHIERLVALAATACRLPEGFAQRTELLTAVHRGIAFWQARNLASDNWWYHDICMPREAGKLMLMLGNEVTAQEKAFLVDAIMAKSRIAMTGQNKIWLSGNVFVRSLFTNEPQKAAEALASVLEELCVTTDEGLQPDWSFHQHGPQLQWGNYGMAYANDLAEWLWQIAGTRFEDPGRVELMRHYLLDGQRWVVWKDCYDISGQGRQLRSGSLTGKARSLAGVCAMMKYVDPACADDYQALIDQINAGGPVRPNEGNRYFWRSDYMVHRSGIFMAGVKMNSANVLGTEAGGNSENLLGGYLSDGACFLYRTGREYTDIFPVWNWRQIPGTTLVHSDQPPPEGGWHNEANKQSFVGGVSDGRSGACVMDYARDGLTARKAWFAHGNTLICLGAGIACDGPEPVGTTLNQCLLNGQVILSDQDGTHPFTGHTLSSSSVSSVTHDGLVYAFPTPQPIQLSCGPQEGSWSRLVAWDSPDTIQKNVFSLHIDHGVKPANARYACWIYPAEAKPAADPQCLSNSNTLQAVAVDDTLMAVFYEAGSLDWGTHGTLETDSPCILLVCGTRDVKQLDLYVADPTRQQSQLTLRLRANGQSSSVVVPLPNGPQAGGSANAVLKMP